MNERRGSTAIEAALFIPILFVLLMGMVEIARITYVYYTLQRTLNAVARQVATLQGPDFCNPSDEAVAAAKNFVLTGTSDGSADSPLPALQPDMIQVAIERFDPTTAEVNESSDCGAGSPDFIVVSIPDGYSVVPRIPFLLQEAIPLRPRVRVPFGGT